MGVLRTYVFKITSICNLNCTYCYMFNGGDTSFLSRPSVMELDVAAGALTKIASYSRANSIPSVYVILHGGEPMMAGKEWFRRFALLAKEIGGNDLTINISMQTNGVLIDDSWLDLLAELGIGFGISLDGPENVNDRTRVNHAGKGSYKQVMRSLECINGHPHGADCFGGVLCVVDPVQNGVEIYQHFRSLGLKSMMSRWVAIISALNPSTRAGPNNAVTRGNVWSGIVEAD